MNKLICASCNTETNSFLHNINGQEYCYNCASKVMQSINAEKNKVKEQAYDEFINQEKIREDNIKELSENIIFTTTNNIDGFFVENYIGVECVEVVLGAGMFSELEGKFSDWFGVPAGAVMDRLNKAKNMAFKRLKNIAVEKGANAVIGIDVDYIEFSKNMFGIIINGTLVKVEPTKVIAESKNGQKKLEGN
ncbi:heavy metal-binding domain-containing protein [Desulfuromonas sp. AOP6]|uniref:YbjQ family protein n=1 Tax=Desulfuromonas sp. AOP6 TaxID=1566351 RepID=UPI00128206C2|nr:heavy metal-binding domain-containing protein [Desulfuromonas sp. AOP6]BCA80952.1 hypothetical protein AOP6_2739 [Desulfuromonas sp. AOP6]